MANGRWDKEPPGRDWQKIAKRDLKGHLKRRREEALERPRDGIRIGNSLATNAHAYITPADLATHMHVVGATVGKSFFFEGLIKQLIEQRQGLCLITPYGNIYERLLDYCAHVHVRNPELRLTERVIPFNIAESRHILGFNPVARNARLITYQVVALMEAIRKCWDQDDFYKTPRLARWLYNIAYALVDSKATLLQAYHMVQPARNAIREAITRRINDPLIREEWQWFLSRSEKEREEKVESTLNRFKPFVGNPRIRQIVGQHTNTIDFSKILSEGKVLLVNLDLQSTVSRDEQHLLGTLLVNEILTAAFARPRGKRRPFYLCIDEFQFFATKDMCEILDGGRQHGLHLVLAHQLLNQLKEKDPEIYFSVLANGRAKVVFGGLQDEDAQIFAGMSRVDLEEIKQEIWHTAHDPVETTRLIHAETHSEGGSDSYSNISHESLASGAQYIPDSFSWSMPVLPQSVTERAGSGTGSSDSHPANWASSRSKSLVPWYEYHPREELTSRTFYSLEEQLYKKKMQLIEQPRQHAGILISTKQPMYVDTRSLRKFYVPDPVRDEFLQECFEAAGIYKTPEEAEREITQLEQKLLETDKTAASAAAVEIIDDTSF